jgi:small ligand-binding sensory domain FIST
MSSPGTRAVVAGSGLGVGPDWQAALGAALDGALAPLSGETPDLLLLFASPDFSDSYSELLATAQEQSGAHEIVGCSASAVIAGERELENEPGVAAMAVRLPSGSALSVWQAEESTGQGPSRCNGVLVLADPFTVNVLALIEQLERQYPGAPIVGGLATGEPGERLTYTFHGRQVTVGGGVIVALGGAACLRPVVSQGCEPIGAVWTITDAEQHIVKGIGGRPAYQVLVDTIQGLEPAQRERVAGNLLVGLAMDEYRDEFKRGDFLIRNLLGVDPSSGMIAIAAEPRVGQTLQFQIRDARAADEELRDMLQASRAHPDRPPAAALLFACNGRGAGLFGTPDHDARTVREVLGPLPLAGLFCNGEIGPVGRATFLHGFTASLALIAPTREA